MVIHSTVWSDDTPSFNAQVETIDWRRLDLVGFERALLRCRRGDVLITNGALGFGERWRDLVSAVATLVVPRGVGLVVSDATWRPRADRAHSRAGPLFGFTDHLNRFLVRRLISPNTVFCFLSPEEVDDFLATTSAPADSAVYTPFMFTLPDDVGDMDRLVRARREPFVFSGGNTMRDWNLLTAALDGSDVPVRVAARPDGTAWPSNFEVAPVAEAEFFRLASTARVGAIALRANVVRSCGQQTYLNLLRLGTPVVVNAAPGVREHLDGVPGASVVAAHDPAAFRAAVLAAFDDGRQPQVRAGAEQGAAWVREHYSRERYLLGLVDVARKLEGRLGSAVPTG